MQHDHKKHRRTDKDRALVLKAISLLRQVSAATNEWQRTQMDEGFTVNQALVLHHLVKHGDATPSGLADWMQVSRGTVTPTVRRLEDLGLITRKADPKDARKQWLTATPEARKITPDVEKKVLYPILSTFADWSTKDLERFCVDLSRVLGAPLFEGPP